jgi:hypothetical protein
MEVAGGRLQPTTAIGGSSQPGLPYSLFLPAALAFFQRALAAAAIFARLAALIFRLAFFTGFAADFRPLTFAHRALCAAAIFALPEALILRLFFGAATATGLVEEPKIWLNSFWRNWILSLMSAARRNCCADRLMIEFMPLN